MAVPAFFGGQAVDRASNTVTAHASTNTKGTYVELFSATAYHVGAIVLMKTFGSAVADFLIDIAIGAALSEQVIIPNLPAGEGSVFNSDQIYIPVSIPKGVRISARCQSTDSAATTGIRMYLIPMTALGRGGLQRCTAYGVNTGDSGGVSIDPGGTINTKPATYTEITANTTAPIRYLLISIGNQNNASRSSFAWLLDIAIGAASSEQIIIPDIPLVDSSGNDQVRPIWYGFEVNIPAGTRIAARAQCSGNDATDRLFDLTVHGFD